MIQTAKIDEVLNKFLEPFELTATISNDWCYCDDKNIIGYALLCPERDNRLFQNFALSLGLNYNVDTFLISLFHEIGHAETMHLLDEEEIAYSDDIKAYLSAQESLSDEEINSYFNLPVEIIATQWAVDFINENAEKLANWWNNEMQPAIIDFFNRYSVRYAED